MTRLRRVTRGDLRIERRRQGQGFGYFAADGSRIRDKEVLARIRHLGIPPAWIDVRIAEYPRAHIQAHGVDAAGRIQYIYHPDWETRRTERKQKQLSLLASALPRLRQRVKEDLRAPTGSKELALAIGVALIDRTAMRVGREKYLDTSGTRGAGTLFSRDVTVKGDEVGLRFPAKSGKIAIYRMRDEELADAIARVKTIPGRRLLLYRNGDGKVRPIRSEELNIYLREATGVRVTAKDFRTLHASAMAAEALAKLVPGESVTARKRQITAVTRQVASFLQNTPTICRKSYIAPCLFDLFDRGQLAEYWAEGGEGRGGLRQRERRLSSLLEALSGSGLRVTQPS